MSTQESAELRQLRAEIDEQPAVIARILDQQHDAVARVADAIRRRAPRVLVLVARGSSDNAAIYGRYLFEIRNRLLTSLAAPSAVTLYGSGPRVDDAVVIGVSQSGRGEDVVSFMRHAREQGALTISIVNDTGSPLAEAAEWVLDCAAGPEVSVPATKTVTAQMTLLAALSAALESDGGETAALARVQSAVEAALVQRARAAEIADALGRATSVAVIGRGYAFSVALELALKLKETSYTRAEPFSAADFIHGPIALVEPGFAALVIDVGGRSHEPARQTAVDVKSRGGEAFLLRVGPTDPPPDGVPSVDLDVSIDEPYAPIPALVLGQLLAVELAVGRGIDPAHPRGLRKVTSTR